MFIYSGKWQESQVFHRYVQRDINSSHLLHEANSAGKVQGTQGAWGQRGHILYTELKHTCFTPLQKKAWQRRQRGRTKRGGAVGGWGARGWFGGFRLIFKYKRTCTNRIASRHCAPIFTVIVTGSRTTPWQDHPFEIYRYKGSLWENKASATRSEIKTDGARGAGFWGGSGGVQTHAWSAAAWGINHCRELHNQVLAIRAHSETLHESSRQLSPHSKRNTCALTALGFSYLACGRHSLYDLRSRVMHHGAVKCPQQHAVV